MKNIFLALILALTSVQAIAQKKASETGYGTQNYLINGNFDLWQRATSVTQANNGPTCGTACGVTAADRWYLAYGGALSSFTYTLSRQAFTAGQTEVPNEPQYFARWNITGCTTPGTSCSGGAGNTRFQQLLENVRTLAGKTVTVSFWARGNVANTPVLKFSQYFGTGGSAGTTTTCSALPAYSATWKKFVSTCTIPSLAGKTIGTETEHYLGMMLLVGETVQQIDFAQVMLNTGDRAAPFALAGGTIGGEYTLASRYCFNPGTAAWGLSTFPGASTIGFHIPMPVAMRKIPDFILNGAVEGTDWYVLNPSSSGAVTGFTLSGSGTGGLYRGVVNASKTSHGMTQAVLYFYTSKSYFDAEL